MANVFNRCSKCKGNMWPSGQMEHSHLTPEELAQLKFKYRTKPQCRSAGAPPRTNSSKAKGSSIRPRRKAYGPF